MNHILMICLIKTMVYCHILYCVNCSNYDIEEESMRLYGEDVKGVLARFRRTRDYANIIKDKMEQVKGNWAGIFAQVKYHYFTLMDTAIKEYLGLDTDTEDLGSNKETDNYYPNTSTASPVQILDEYSRTHQKLSAKEKNSFKDIGYEYARRAIHTYFKSMGVDVKDRPTKMVFLEDSTTKKKRKTTKDANKHKSAEENAMTTTSTTPKPTTTSTTPKPTTTTKPCNVGYKYYALTGHCYLLHKETATWADANRTCIAEGARLAVINSKDEQRVLVEVFKQTPPEEINHAAYNTDDAYIGLYRISGEWKTVDGQTLAQAGFAEWRPGALPQDERHPYGVMNRQGFYGNRYGTNNYVFICQEM